jgi:hypothetical protein
MADNTVIAASVKIDVSASTKSMNELNAAIKESKKALADAKIGSKEYIQASKELKEQEDLLQKSLSAANDEKQKSGEAFGLLKSKVQGLVPGLKSAEGGIQSFGTQLKILAANPIILMLTAIVIGLGLIYEAFTSTVEGGKAMKQIFAEIEAAGTILKDAIFGLYRGMADLYVAAFKFITLDFKGAAESFKKAGEEASGSMKEFGKLTDGTLKKFGELEKAQQQNDVARKKSAVVISETNKLLVQSREILTDENATIAQKKKALAEVTAAETKSSAERVRIANEDLRIIKAKQEAFGIESNNAKKLNGEVRELTIAANEAAQENAQTEIKLNKQRKQLEKQEKSERAEADKAAKEKEKERITNLREFTMKDLKMKQELELAAITDAKQKELKIIDNAYQEELRDNKVALEQKKLTTKQYDILNNDALLVANEKKKEATKKFDEEKEKKDKEAKQKEIDETRKFDAELNKINLEIRLAGITDAREKERIQLQISFAERFKQVEETYKNDEKKLVQLKAALTIQQHAAELALDKKYADEDLKATEQLSFKKIAFQLTQAKKDLKLQEKLLDEKDSLIKSQYQREISEAGLTAQKKAEIEQKYTEDVAAQTEARKQLAKAEMDAKIAAADGIASTLGNAAELFGKQTALGKTLAIASATISMFTSAQKAYEATVGIPFVGPVLAPINAGLAIATGIKNIQSIASVEVPGASGGGSSISAPSAPIAPTQTSTKLDAQSIQGVGNAASAGVGRTFVLDSDINNSEERKRRLVRAARLQ